DIARLEQRVADLAIIADRLPAVVARREADFLRSAGEDIEKIRCADVATIEGLARTVQAGATSKGVRAAVPVMQEIYERTQRGRDTLGQSPFDLARKTIGNMAWCLPLAELKSADDVLGWLVGTPRYRQLLTKNGSGS